MKGCFVFHPEFWSLSAIALARIAVHSAVFQAFAYRDVGEVEVLLICPRGGFAALHAAIGEYRRTLRGAGLG